MALGDVVPTVGPVETEQGLLHADSAVAVAATVDVPGMTVEESSVIAARWNRKQSTFMPVGDPYEEPDTSVPYARRLAQSYCTVSHILTKIKQLIIYIFPVFEWFPKMSKASLTADTIAGLTVGVMLIPQSMSYADIAGLQYRYGLYTSVLPLITYALMGSSRQLGVGPVAMVSLLVEVGLNGALTEEECPEYFAQFNNTNAAVDGSRRLAESSDPLEQRPQYELCPDQYAQLAFMTSLLVGLFQLGAGVLRLGFLVSFLAHPVISGFTSAAAIIIGLSQLQYFFGFKIPKSQYVVDTIRHIFMNLQYTEYQQLLFGLAWWFALSMSRRASLKYKKKLGWLKPSAPLIMCILAILVGGNMEYFNGCGFTPCNATLGMPLTVGYIPPGVSSMGSINLLDGSKLNRVLTTAVSCSVIGYMESIAIAKSLASKHKYEIDAGQELISLGVANVLGSMTSSYPVTGSFSRSAVNNQTGAQTQLAGMITGCLLLVTLLALTKVFEFLPKFSLAAIVISSVTNLVDYKEFFHLIKVKKQDALLWGVAFLGTLFLGVQVGLLMAIGVSLLMVIVESVRPQMTILWRLPATPIYRSIKQESTGQFIPSIVILRIGASMYFANVAFIRDYINKMLHEFSEAADTTKAPANASPRSPAAVKPPEPIRYIVVEMTPVTTIDSTAIHMLEDMQRDLKGRGIRLAFATIGTRVEDTMSRAGLIEKIGEQWFHPSVHFAVQHCIRHRDEAALSKNSDAEEAMPTTPEKTAAKAIDIAAASPPSVMAPAACYPNGIGAVSTTTQEHV